MRGVTDSFWWRQDQTGIRKAGRSHWHYITCMIQLLLVYADGVKASLSHFITANTACCHPRHYVINMDPVDLWYHTAEFCKAGGHHKLIKTALSCGKGTVASLLPSPIPLTLAPWHPPRSHACPIQLDTGTSCMAPMHPPCSREPPFWVVCACTTGSHTSLPCPPGRTVGAARREATPIQAAPGAATPDQGCLARGAANSTRRRGCRSRSRPASRRPD